MLYDPKWEKPEVKADPFSLEALIAWLEKQPSDQEYCYLDHGYCLISQYLTSVGFKGVQVYSLGDFKHDDSNGLKQEYPREMDSVALMHPWTFGAALKRARKNLAA